MICLDLRKPLIYYSIKKMDNEILEAIKLLLNKENNTIRVQLIIILMIGLLLFVAVNLLIPMMLNRSNRKNAIKQIKIERKISDIELLIDMLKVVQTISISDDSEKTKEEIDKSREFVNRKSYRFPASMRHSIYELLDYFSECIVHPSLKNPSEESILFDKIYKDYEKLA